MSWINGLWFCLVVVLIIDHDGETDAARILGLFPLNGKSHFVMSEALLRALAARGHHVDVISHFPLKKPPPNYHDISIAGTLPPIVNNLTLATAEQLTRGSVGSLVEFAGTKMCELLNLPQFQNIIKNPPTDPPYDAVIIPTFASDCYLAFGRHLKVPIVAVVTCRMIDWLNAPMGNPLNSAFVPSIFSNVPQRMNFLQRLTNTIQIINTNLQYAYHISAQLPFVEKHFGIKIQAMSELYKDVAVMLVNSHPSFDGVRPTTPGVVEVGGLHVNDGDQDLAPEVKKWLDDSKAGCVYFSFGSMVKIESFPNHTVKAFYAAFESIAPVTVLMKIARKDQLLEGLPKNVMTYPWLPQTRVLQHKNVRVFVSHGGLMSTQEAVTYGVPMVHVPLFADQHLNAALCKSNNVSIVIDHRTVTPDEFTKALKTVLEEPSYSRNANRLSKLFVDRPIRAVDTATYWVEYVIRNGGVLRSPAVELTWWQLKLLDVYGFIVILVLLTLYIIKRILGFVICLLCSNNTMQKGASKSKKNK